MSAPWLSIERGCSPVVLSIPHAGIAIPAQIEDSLVDPWLARKDADWYLDQLYSFAQALDITVVKTSISRTVIDVNRDPLGRSLYPGQATTELCPTTTFDGEPLYRQGQTPCDTEIAVRKARWFSPYHEALVAELARLRALHTRVVLFDAHSIRSSIPRLFEGILPEFNIGTNDGKSCAPGLTAAVEAACATTAYTRVTNGRFRGGWITRHHGKPATGVHAIQMELACRSYLDEPAGSLTQANWPPRYDEERARDMSAALAGILDACFGFATATRAGDSL